MLLSIIIPVYNTEIYLNECIESLYCQGLEESNFEIIFVNDGSTDHSANVAELWMDKHTNIRIYNQKNQGQAVARNFGLNNARGKYVIFVDSDDYIVDNTISILLNLAQLNDTDLCIFSLIEQRSDGYCKECKPRYSVINHVLSGEQILLGGYNAASACAIIYKREFIELKHFRFHSGFAHEDVEFSSRITPFAKRVIISDINAYVYRWNENSTDRSMDIERIKYGFISNLYVAASLKESINNESFSIDLNKLYIRKCNSIVVSLFFNLIRKKMFDIEFVKKCIETAKYLGLYPVDGRTVSWKTSIIIPLVNFEYLYYFLYRNKKA